MNDDVKALVEALVGIESFGASFNRDDDSWRVYTNQGDERVCSIAGYETKKVEKVLAILRGAKAAAATITAQADEIERLNAIVKRVQGAAKTIMHHEGEELARLRKQAQEHHLAIRTLDSEREANALLTDEIERLREIVRLFTGAAYPVSQEINERGYNWSEAYLDQALKAAQEVKP